MTKPRTETILYLLAFLLALGLRLSRLGSAPLSDFEAGWALQSFDLARGASLIPGAQVAYLLPTAFLFAVFQDANFTARLLPALTGALLTLSPYAFRRQLGQKAALMLAFGLALDPGLVTLSRMAGSPMMAVAFLVLTGALLMPEGAPSPSASRATRYALAGVAAGLMLLSGAAVITGALGVGIAFGLARLTGALPGWRSSAGRGTSVNLGGGALAGWKIALAFGIGTLLLVGTLFFLYPQGLAGWASTLDAYFALWTHWAGIPAGRLLAALFFYAILPLIFGVAGAVRGWVRKSDPARALSLWFLAALLLPLLMPGRQVGDLAWALLPLWALAALELARYARPGLQPWTAAGLAAGIFVLMSIIWLTFAALDNAPPENVPRYQVVLVASLLIGALGTLLVAVSWSLAAAWDGLAWGLTAGLAVYMLSAMFGASQVRPNTPQEWWWPLPTPKHAALLGDTLADLGLMQRGRADSLDAVSLVDAPSLRWLLRNVDGVRYAASLEMETFPAVVITRPDDPLPPAWEKLYRGQDFGFWQLPAWGSALPPDLFSWLTNRNAPVATDSVFVWARLDLFPADLVAPAANEDALPAP